MADRNPFIAFLKAASVDFILISFGIVFQSEDPENEKLVLNLSILAKGTLRFIEPYLFVGLEHRGLRYSGARPLITLYKRTALFNLSCFSNDKTPRSFSF